MATKGRTTKSISRLAIKPSDLRWQCDPNVLGFETTASLESKPNIIGQDRALQAIRLGLDLRSPGYNIFVSGLTGVGKLTAIRYELEAMDLSRSDLKDICYVHNFRDTDAPACLVLKKGQAVVLKKRLEELLRTVTEVIPVALQSESFKRKQATIADEIKKRRDDMQRALEKDVVDQGFSVQQIEYGEYTRPEIVPVVGEEPVPVDRLPSLLAKGKIKQAEYDRLQSAYPELSRRLDDLVIASRQLQGELDRRTAELEKKQLSPLVDYTVKDLTDLFKNDKVSRFLQDLRNYILDHLPLFALPHPEPEQRRIILPFLVNVLVDNTGRTEAPVVIETSPSYANVFGVIERVASAGGDNVTDHMAIRGGSLLSANGGFLVLNLIDIFEEPMLWNALKRALKSQRHTIRGFDSLLLVPIASIKPEPILLDIKIVLIGDQWSYQYLYEYDEDFRTIFKVKADFDSVMENNPANRKRYGRFVRTLSELESLPDFHKGAVAAIIEEGVRIAGRRNKLSTRFSDVGDISREAAHWARKRRSAVVREEDVNVAVRERRRRVNLPEDKVQELFEEGTILIDVSGSKIGQINGLAVYDVGDFAFGRPSRITAETGVGRSGVINIERESELSGRIHNKGLLILEGYIRRMYAQDKPITVSASLAFEQGYSSVDGDSASCAEMYALMSSLAFVPLRQDIAVTGSMNQKGEVQPIGGVNEKVEGFFDVCKARGLTKQQGVMIPASNVGDLMLRQDIVDAVEKKQFHIYAVSTIDEGIEVLTGKRAGRWIPPSGYETGTMHYLVDQGLRHFHDRLRDAEDGHTEVEKTKVVEKKSESKDDKPRPPRKRRRRERNRADRRGR
ncbi:MAG TPA: AAA family ATPase [Candidatus Krumholzibacteria bacterium]|nr:AAA family ATPase [Candidatus Krumholzibacteria bacterium]